VENVYIYIYIYMYVQGQIPGLFNFCMGRFRDIWHFPGLSWKKIMLYGRFRDRPGNCHINVMADSRTVHLDVYTFVHSDVYTSNVLADLRTNVKITSKLHISCT